MGLGQRHNLGTQGFTRQKKGGEFQRKRKVSACFGVTPGDASVNSLKKLPPCRKSIEPVEGRKDAAVTAWCAKAHALESRKEQRDLSALCNGAQALEGGMYKSEVGKGNEREAEEEIPDIRKPR